MSIKKILGSKRENVTGRIGGLGDFGLTICLFYMFFRIATHLVINSLAEVS